MEKQERLKTILGISLLYMVTTSIFSLMNKVCSSLFSQNDFGVKIRFFLQSNLLWIMIVAAIMIALILYLKKLNAGSHYRLLDNSMIRVTAGLLVILEGIVSLSNTIPLYAASIQSAIQSSQMIQQSMQRMLTGVIMSDVVSVIILLCQVLAGVYLIKFYKAKVT